MAKISDLPLEIKALIVSFCDFPTIIILLRVDTYFHSLAVPIASDHDLRMQFLLDYETSPRNRNYKYPTTVVGKSWYEKHQEWWASKLMYICFSCKKLRPHDKFATGQLYRMMLPDDYSSHGKRFCIDCGMTAVPRKYVPGSMIRSAEWECKVLLCGRCKEWTPDFYCMREKKCFQCTEHKLRDAEKFVSGFKHGFGTAADESLTQKLLEQTRALDGGDQTQVEASQQNLRKWPKRPPCCRSCGDHWRYTPIAFGYSNMDTRCMISGTPKREMEQIEDRFMSWFCPYPQNLSTM